MCVHLLFGPMLLGSRYSSNVCQSYTKPGSVPICSLKHPVFKKIFLRISTFILNVLFFTLKQA